MDVEVVHSSVGGAKYITVGDFRGWGKHILALRSSFATVQGYSGDVPIFERLYAGGAGSVRGFQYRGIGPTDPVTGDHIGGEYMLLTGAEYSVPIVSRYVRAHAFLDTGATEKELGDVASEMRAAWGVGLQIRLPQFGWIPITFDFGFPLIKKQHDDTQIFTFTMGSGFFGF